MSSALNLDFALMYHTIHANASIDGINVYEVDIPKGYCKEQSTAKAFWRAMDVLENLGYKIQSCLYDFIDSEEKSPGFCASVEYLGTVAIKEECENIIALAFPEAFPEIQIDLE